MCVHDTRAKVINALYDRVTTSDAIVAKAALATEVAQIAKIEVRLRELLVKQWDIRKVEAAAAAATAVAGGKSAAAAAGAIDGAMSKWAKDVTQRYVDGITEAYKLARTAGLKKAKGQIKSSLQYNTPNATAEELVAKARERTGRVRPSFDLADQEAIDSLSARNVFWIGEHYDENVSASVAEVTRSTLAEQGSSRRAAALLMRERVIEILGSVVTPGGFHGSSIQYFEGLAANAVTVARSFGQLRSFRDAGVERYAIVNPNDSRTCVVCQHMDGKTFTTQQGSVQMDAEVAAESPDDIKRIHPWVGIGALRQVSSSAGRLEGRAGARDSAALAGAGLALPPFHFRCRCTVDMAL